MIATGDMINGTDSNQVCLVYGDRWRLHRRLMHSAVGSPRQCSGHPLAEQDLFLTVATLLWAFDIKPGLDDHRNEVKLDVLAFTKSENMRPEPFKARFIPRSKKMGDIIRSEAGRARKDLAVFDGETRSTMENVP